MPPMIHRIQRLRLMKLLIQMQRDQDSERSPSVVSGETGKVAGDS